ncbi:MAG: hypothetical protein ACR2ML_11560 [Solirubrobacteraceae bacterium]
MRLRLPVLALAALLGVALATTLVSCGGDDEPAADDRGLDKPELTVPGTQPLTTPTQATTPTTSTTSTSGPGGDETGSADTSTDDSGSGDTGSGSGDTGSGDSSGDSGGSGGSSGGSDGPADSSQNDVPPPQDSPASDFEEFCRQNPGAC